MANTWKPSFGGNANQSAGAPAQSAPQPSAGQPQRAAASAWDDYVPGDARPLADAPPPPAAGSGGRTRSRDEKKMGPGKYVAWVDSIARWPRGDGTMLVVGFCSTGYQDFGWDQEAGPALLRPENETALSYWTSDFVALYVSLGFPDSKWPRRPAADGTPRRVPPWSHFWHVDTRSGRAPIAFDIEIGANHKGYPELRSIAPMAGPRLAPLPTTLPEDLALHLGWPHEVKTFTVGRNAAEVRVAKLERGQYLTGTDLVTIEALLPRKRGT